MSNARFALLAFIIPLTANIACFVTSAHAQEVAVTATAEPAPEAVPIVVEEEWAMRIRIGAEAVLHIPVADWQDAADIGLGAHIRVALDPLPILGLTGRVGYVHQIGTGDLTWGVIPILFGGEWRILGPTWTPFLAAELGLSIGIASGNTAYGSASDTDVGFSLAIGGGYRFGPVDLRADFYVLDADDAFGFRVMFGGDFLSF